MRKSFKVFYVLLLVLVLSACSSGDFKADHKYKIAPFEFTNHHNEKVSLDDLKGKVWLAQFVFTNCDSVCGPMMFNMAKLQHDLIDKGLENYKIVSFSVDPEIDTPEMLNDYLEVYAPIPGDEKIKWDESKWEMLTGYKQDEIEKLAMDSFKTIVIKSPESDQVFHAVLYSLVNQDGEVVKQYNGVEDVQFEQIVKDMIALNKSGS